MIVTGVTSSSAFGTEGPVFLGVRGIITGGLVEEALV